MASSGIRRLLAGKGIKLSPPSGQGEQVTISSAFGADDAVTQIIPGLGITISPPSGKGPVVVSATPVIGPSLNAFYLVNQATNAPPNGIDLSTFGTGVLQQVVSGGVASIFTTSLDLDCVPFVAGEGTLLSDPGLKYFVGSSGGLVVSQRVVTPEVGTQSATALTFKTDSTTRGGFDSSGAPYFANLSTGTTALVGATDSTGHIALVTIGSGLSYSGGTLSATGSAIADQRLIGNVAGGTAVPSALTASQVSTFLGLDTAATHPATDFQPALSLTAGSVLFSGGGSAVSEDNANFYYDPPTTTFFVPQIYGNNALTLGNGAGPASTIVLDESAITLSAPGPGRVRIDGMTEGSVPFVGDSDGGIYEDDKFTYDPAGGAVSGSKLTLGVAGSFGSGSVVQINAEDNYIDLGGGVRAGLYIANSYPQAASVAVDRHFFGQGLIGWSPGLGLATELTIGAGTGGILHLTYATDAVGAGTDAIAIDGTTGGITITAAVGQSGGAFSIGGDLSLTGGTYASTGLLKVTSGAVTVDTTPYLSTTTAASTYETQSHAASTYWPIPVGLTGDASGNARIGKNATLATNATDGFPQMPAIAGAFTGTPTMPFTGGAPFGFDRNHNNLVVWNSTGNVWQAVPSFSATVSAGSVSWATNNGPTGYGATTKWLAFTLPGLGNIAIPYLSNP